MAEVSIQALLREMDADELEAFARSHPSFINEVNKHYLQLTGKEFELFTQQKLTT